MLSRGATLPGGASDYHMAKKKSTPKALTPQSNVSTAQVVQALSTIPEIVQVPYEYPTQVSKKQTPQRTPTSYSSSNTIAGSSHATTTTTIGTVLVDAILVHWNLNSQLLKAGIGTVAGRQTIALRVIRGGATIWYVEGSHVTTDTQFSLTGSCAIVLRVGDVIELKQQLDEDNCICYSFGQVTAQPFR
jgi:hypothetical protein